MTTMPRPVFRLGSQQRTTLLCAVLLGVSSAIEATSARPQLSRSEPLQLADASPRFVSEPSPTAPDAPRVDLRGATVLRQEISVDFREIPLGDALRDVAARAGLQLTVSKTLVHLGAPVTLAAPHITVGATLTALLYDAGVDVQLSRDGFSAAVIPKTAVRTVRSSASAQAVGAVVGRIMDQKSGQGIPHASVLLEGTSYRAASSGDGGYVVQGVPAGSYHMAVRVLGYASLTKLVTVVADSTVRLDFALAPAVATLNEVVVTGAGPQRRIELGNAIATINADSVSRQAPVTDLTDLLSGRAANVDVLSGTGMVGDGPAIRIRGRSSITGSNDPIVFVDGVRTDASPGGTRDVFGAVSFSPTPSALNDLNPNELESIEILRGPSAATEYGTDAANGVIVIKTKHGQAGPPRWDVGTEQGITAVPGHFPLNYTSWGHTTDGTNTPTFCPTVNSFGGPGRFAGTCVADSITTWQPLDHASTSILGTGGRHAYSLQFSEGTPRVRYFAAGDLSDELGVLRMPPAEQLRVAREQGAAIPSTERYPNQEQQVSLRGQATGTVGRTAEASVSTAYLATTQRAPSAENGAVVGALVGAGYRDSLSGYSSIGVPPGDLFAIRSGGTTNRFIGGLSATSHPTGWVTLRGTAGVDDQQRANTVLAVPGTGGVSVASFFPGGYRGTGRYRTGVYTADVGAIVTASLGAWLGTKTAAGVQYYDTRHSGTAIGVTNIGIGNPTLNGGSVTQNSILEQGDEELTLGAYIDETLSVADRLYLTAAVRLDAGSGFGKQYNSALYPKASISWAISQEPHNLLRLRAAYGQSGVQPQPGAALRLYAPAPALMGGTLVPGDTVASFGNGHLRPERSSELEAGADVGVLDNRLTFELTGYVKTTTDALVSAPVPSSLGGGSLQENLGEVRNRGIEASLTGHPVDRRFIAWDVTLSGSINDNKLVTLGSGVQPIDQSFFYPAPYRQTPGYPLYGLWALPLRYRDANHDGLIEPNEVSLGDSVTFQGSSIPTRQLSLNTGLSLLNHRVRLSTQIEYRGGNKLANSEAFLRSVFSGQFGGQALNSPVGVSLAEQARAVALASTGNFRANSGTIEDASFTRWRELSVAYFVPERLAAAVRARTASLTLAVRNLALWSHYTGLDPEVSNSNSVFLVPVAGLPTTAINHDIVGDYGALPLTRYWVLKLAFGL